MQRLGLTRTRQNGTFSAKRLSLHLLLALGLLASMLVAGQTGAGAVHVEEFQLDGNIADDASATEDFDWASFFNGSGGQDPTLPAASRPCFLDSAFKADHAFPDATTFTSGSKDTLDTSGWSCSSSNNLGGKFDIVNAYSTIYQDGSDLVLYFGIERAATEGDGTMGFWFLKDASVDCEKLGGGKAPAFSGHHTNGDIFVTAEFSNGGTNAQVQAYAWVGGAEGHLDTTTAVANGNKCITGANSGDSACGIVNDAPLDPPWPAPDKNGGDLDVNAFYEGGVKVPSSGGCFAAFIANTRSSTSATATIFDYARGSFPTCQAGTELKLASYQINSETAVTTGLTSPVAITTHTGDSLKLTYTEENTGNFTLDKPTGKGYVVIPNSTQESACVLAEVQTSGFNTGDTNQNSKLDGGETWTYDCTVTASSTTPETIAAYGHGIDNVSSLPTVKDVTFCETPASANPVLAPATAATCDTREKAVVNLTVLAPSTSMTASLEATITFYETNDGNAPLEEPGDGAFVRLSGTDECTSFGPVLKTSGDTTKNIGDADDDGTLDSLETWQWSCTVSLAATASSTSISTATGHGIDTTNGTDVTFCTGANNSPPAYETVKLLDNATDATPLCNVNEQRTVTLKVE